VVILGTSKTGTTSLFISGAHLIDLLGVCGTPEWIRTTDLAPEAASFPQLLITEEILLQENSI
jgi:hypothetical protein